MRLTLTTDEGKVLGVWIIHDEEFSAREVRELVAAKLPIDPEAKAGAKAGCLVSLYADGRFQEWCTLASFLEANTALCSEELHEMFCCFAWGRLWEIGGGAAQRYGVKLYEPGDEDRDFNSDDPADHGAVGVAP